MAQEMFVHECFLRTHAVSLLYNTLGPFCHSLQPQAILWQRPLTVYFYPLILLGQTKFSLPSCGKPKLASDRINRKAKQNVSLQMLSAKPQFFLREGFPLLLITNQILLGQWAAHKNKEVMFWCVNHLCLPPFFL